MLSSPPFIKFRQLLRTLSVLSPFVCLCWFCFVVTTTVGDDVTFAFRLARWFGFSSSTSSLWFNSESSPNSLLSLEWLLLWLIVDPPPLPLLSEDCRIFEISSVRSLRGEGRIGIGIGVAAAVVIEEVGVGKGGGGPVGDVGTGWVIPLPSAGVSKEFWISPLFGMTCGTTGADPIGGWYGWCDG